jgi:hypothetical protein
MKYPVSILISLALFLVFRPNYDYTLKTRKIKIHPVICFIATWIGGLALGFLIGPFVIGMLGGNR